MCGAYCTIADRLLERTHEPNKHEHEAGREGEQAERERGFCDLAICDLPSVRSAGHESERLLDVHAIFRRTTEKEDTHNKRWRAMWTGCWAAGLMMCSPARFGGAGELRDLTSRRFFVTTHLRTLRRTVQSFLFPAQTLGTGRHSVRGRLKVCSILW